MKVFFWLAFVVYGVAWPTIMYKQTHSLFVIKSVTFCGADFAKGLGDTNCTLLRYQARLEAGCYSNIAKARLLWQEVMKARGHHANYWLEYANMERSVASP